MNIALMFCELMQCYCLAGDCNGKNDAVEIVLINSNGLNGD